MLLELPGRCPKRAYILKWRYMASKFLSLFSEHLPLMCEVKVCGTNGMVARLLGHEPRPGGQTDRYQQHSQWPSQSQLRRCAKLY
jgi:hypothetical protein